MNFFADMTPFRIAGLALLIAGALVTFLSGRLTEGAQYRHANAIVKIIGLGTVFTGFALIMFI